MIDILNINTQGVGFYEITSDVAQVVKGQGDGVLTLLIRHTSSQLADPGENADPDVRTDLLAWLDRLAPPADAPQMGWITHRLEGPDDMPAHIVPGLAQLAAGAGARRADAAGALAGHLSGRASHPPAPAREVALAFTPT